MSKLSSLAAVLLASALCATPALAADKPKAFATVNGQAIPQGLADALISEQKAQGAPDSPELTANVKETLVRSELLSQEAKKKGLDKKPEIAAQLELAKQTLLARAFINDYLRTHPVTDEMVKQEYERVKAERASAKEFKARHILVETENEAKDIIAKLNVGEKFADLAKVSKDPGSKDNGGDLGWAIPNGFDPDFAAALVKLEKGKFTAAPVRTRFGYHVIQVEDTRALTTPPLEQVKPQVTQSVTQGIVQKLITELRAKAKVD